MNRAYIIFALVVGSLLNACGGGIPGSTDVIGGSGSGIFGSDSTGGGSLNPATRPTPGFTEVTVNPATSTTQANLQKFSRSVKFLGLNVGVIELDEVRLVIENFNFDDAVSPGIEGPGFVILRLIQNGLIVDETLPLLGTAILPEGVYHTLDFNYRVLAASEIPPEAHDDPVITQYLVGHSIVIEGSFAIDVPLLNGLPILGPIIEEVTDWLKVRVPFRFLSDQTSTIRIEDVDGLTFFGQDTTHFLYIAHKVQLWFDLTVGNLLQSLSLTVLPLVGEVVTGVLNLDIHSTVAAIANIALTVEQNINGAFRFALSPDDVFNESEVLEASFSFVLLP